MRQWPAAACFAVLAGCVSFGKMASDPTEIVYGNDAESNMRAGNDALADKNYPEAARYFEYVRNKFPYLEAAREADLKLADTDYLRDQFVAARDRYKNFERLHPTHPRVDYAAFRAAETHYKDIPSDFFLLPPSAEKDQIEVRSALAAMNEFVRMYPKSEYVKDAQVVLADVKHRLGEHEVYVAEFYAKREKWNAVISRYTTVTKYYAGVGFDESAAFGLYEAYTALNRPDEAKEALHVFVWNFPKDPAAPKAVKIIGADFAKSPLNAPPLILQSEGADAGR